MQVALTLRDTSMFSGLRCRDLPLNESVGSLCDYAKTSDSLEHLCLSGVLPDAARLSGTGARSSLRLLVEALAAGAATRLPLTELDLSHNELRDGGVLAVCHTGLEPRTSRARGGPGVGVGAGVGAGAGVGVGAGVGAAQVCHSRVWARTGRPATARQTCYSHMRASPCRPRTPD